MRKTGGFIVVRFLALALCWLGADWAGASELRLMATDGGGEERAIVGFERLRSQLLAYYLGEDGTKTYVGDWSKLRFSGGVNGYEDYAYTPGSYEIYRSASDARWGKPGESMLHVKLSKAELGRVWPKAADSEVVVVVTTFENGILRFRSARKWPLEDASLKQIYRDRVFSSANLGPVQTSEVIPYILVFRQGGFLRSSEGGRWLSYLGPVPSGIEDLDFQIEMLARAARNGRVDLLRERLGSVSMKKSDYTLLLDSLLVEALVLGRGEASSFLLEAGGKPFSEGCWTFRSLHREAFSRYSWEGLINSDMLAFYGHLESILALESSFKTKAGKPHLGGLLRDAIIRKQFDVAEALVAFGAVFSGSDFNRETGAYEAVLHNRIELAENLMSLEKLSPERKARLVWKVAAWATPAVLEKLASIGAELDEPDEDGNTPLMLAAGYGNIQAVCWFLDRGARLEQVNKRGHTALQYSIVQRQMEAASCILDRGADINSLGPKGVTPYMQALLFEDADIAKAIGELGGIWNLDSEFLDATVRSVAEQDSDFALELALEQGLDRQSRIFGNWPLDWFLAYYEARACLEALGVARKVGAMRWRLTR